MFHFGKSDLNACHPLSNKHPHPAGLRDFFQKTRGREDWHSAKPGTAKAEGEREEGGPGQTGMAGSPGEGPSSSPFLPPPQAAVGGIGERC